GGEQPVVSHGPSSSVPADPSGPPPVLTDEAGSPYAGTRSGSSGHRIGSGDLFARSPGRTAREVAGAARRRRRRRGATGAGDRATAAARPIRPGRPVSRRPGRVGNLS